MVRGCGLAPSGHAIFRVFRARKAFSGSYVKKPVDVLFRVVTPTCGRSDRLNAVQGHSESRYLHTAFAVLGLQDQPSITGEPVPSDSLLTHDKVSLSLVTNEEKRGHRDAAPKHRTGCRACRDRRRGAGLRGCEPGREHD